MTKGELWKNPMKEEMESLKKNETWNLVMFPNGRKPIGSKWVLNKNMNVAGHVNNYKGRLVVKGYYQVKGVEFGEFFSPVANLTFIRVLIF